MSGVVIDTLNFCTKRNRRNCSKEKKKKRWIGFLAEERCHITLLFTISFWPSFKYIWTAMWKTYQKNFNVKIWIACTFVKIWIACTFIVLSLLTQNKEPLQRPSL